MAAEPVVEEESSTANEDHRQQHSPSSPLKVLAPGREYLRAGHADEKLVEPAEEARVGQLVHVAHEKVPSCTDADHEEDQHEHLSHASSRQGPVQ